MNLFLKDVSPFFNLLLIPAVVWMIKLNKNLTAIKFYTRKLCEAQDPPIRCGKDLD